MPEKERAMKVAPAARAKAIGLTGGSMAPVGGGEVFVGKPLGLVTAAFGVGGRPPNPDGAETQSRSPD